MTDEENAGVNTVMQRLRAALPVLLQSDTVAEKLDESYSYLDVAGYNYSDARYEVDGRRMPNRVIVGTETHNTNIAQNWPKVLELAHVIGDFTWTGWDYLGEVGLGRVEYGDDSGLLMGDYPWLAAWCADIDITGQRRALSYLRETVFGLRSEPHVSVQDPMRHGETPSHLGLAGEPWLEGLLRGRGPARGSPDHGRRHERCRRGGASGQRRVHRPPTGRTAACAFAPHSRRPSSQARSSQSRTAKVSRWPAPLCNPGPDLAGIDVRADRTEIRADDTDLAYIDITLVDGDGRLHHAEERADHGRGRGIRRAIWGWAAPTRAQRRRSAGPATTHSTGGLSPSCDRPRPAPSPLP